MKAPLMATWFGLAMLTSLFVLCFIREQEEGVRQRRIVSLIRQLDTDDPRIHERAAQELVAIGLPALAPLTAVLEDENGTARRTRAQDVYDRLAIYQPGGDWADGMKLCLRADCESARPGDTVWFTITVCNLNDEPMVLQSGSFAWLERGWPLRRVPEPAGENADLEMGPQRVSPSRIRLILYGSHIVEYDRISPRCSRTIRVPALLVKEKNRCYLRMGTEDPLRLDLPDEGPARMRVVLDNRPRPTSPLSASDYFGSEGAWQGIARSNDVLLRILPAVPGYVPPSRPATLVVRGGRIVTRLGQ